MTISLESNGFVGRFLTSFRSFHLLVILGVAISLLAVHVIYTLYFHPLARYPGPFFARLTNWYDVYHSYMGDKHILLYHLHRRYGTVVRVGPNALSINDPASLKDLYGHNANARKSTFYETFRARPDAISTFLTTNIQDHARKRRVMAHAFSDTAMRGLEEHVTGHIEDMVDRIRASIRAQSTRKTGWSTAVDMSTWCTWMVFDIMGDLVFSRSFGTLGPKPENREGIRLLGRAARRNYTCGAMPSLASTGAEQYLPWLRGLYQDRCKYLAFGMKQVQERMRESGLNKSSGKDAITTDRKDIFSFLLNAKDPETGEGFSMGELWMEGNTLIVAGSDSTSTVLAATLYYIVSRTDVLTRLTQEVRAAFPTRDDIHTGPALTSLTYLRACIDESMRMTPSLGGVLPREVMPGGLELPALGLRVPAGVVVGIPVYATHHHEDYVVDPFVYNPDRWFGAAGQDTEALHAAFTPFSTGRHACLGKPLVYMEISLAIARLLWEFDLRMAVDQRMSGFLAKEEESGKRQKGEYHLLDWFMSKNEGPWMVMRPREEM